MRHILDSIDSVNQYTKDKSEQQFISSPEVQDAVLMRLSVIGEAAKNLPSSLREKHNSIDWKAVIGLKNIIVHQYFGVDIKIVWNIVKDDLPKLKSEVKEMLKEKP
jgi:uncharacterized protein with HEPN domain